MGLEGQAIDGVGQVQQAPAARPVGPCIPAAWRRGRAGAGLASASPGSRHQPRCTGQQRCREQRQLQGQAGAQHARLAAGLVGALLDIGRPGRQVGAQALVGQLRRAGQLAAGGRSGGGILGATSGDSQQLVLLGHEHRQAGRHRLEVRAFGDVHQPRAEAGQAPLDGLAAQLHLLLQRGGLGRAAQHQVQGQQAAQLVDMADQLMQQAGRRQGRLFQQGQCLQLGLGLPAGQRRAQPRQQQQQRQHGTKARAYRQTWQIGQIRQLRPGRHGGQQLHLGFRQRRRAAPIWPAPAAHRPGRAHPSMVGPQAPR